MCDYPDEVEAALDELGHHYDNFEENKRGANGYLFFAKNRVSRRDVAIKFYCGQQGERQHDEPRLLAAIDSPNVLSILDARLIAGEWGYFVTPRCSEGDIDDLIQSRPSAHRAVDAAIAICHGVSAIHARRMVHRDLKPGNIVLDGGAPRIADFGSVRAFEAGQNTTHASRHSILYRPPESFDADEYGKHGDVYQIGIVTYQMLGGTLSYNGEDYLSNVERLAYNAQGDPVERSLMVDAAIARCARAGSLTKLGSLPPWVSNGAKRCLADLLAPAVIERIASASDAAARLSRMRVSLRDWRWDGNIACLPQGDARIEVRPTAEGQYEAFRVKNGTARRVQGLVRGDLRQVIQQIP